MIKFGEMGLPSSESPKDGKFCVAKDIDEPRFRRMIVPVRVEKRNECDHEKIVDRRHRPLASKPRPNRWIGYQTPVQ
jgi:hypothetical protein